MKCDLCGAKAAMQMRQHRLALCRDHYLEWLPRQVQRTIEKYHLFQQEDKILVAVSGGKDSLSLWDMLSRLGYHADGLYINLGIDGGLGYSSRSAELCQSFAEQRGLRLLVVDVPAEYGRTIPEMAAAVRRGGNKPCAVCGLTKRHIMNRIAAEGGYTALATGHNLDDEAAVLLGNTLEWKLDSMQRQGPILQARPGFARKVKPLCRIYERESAAYALLAGIDYIYDECPYAAGNKAFIYKDLLNRMEASRPGAKLRFYIEFLRAQKEGFLDFARQAVQEDLHPCPSCGQPTTADSLCAFCRMVAQNSSAHSSDFFTDKRKP